MINIGSCSRQNMEWLDGCTCLPTTQIPLFGLAQPNDMFQYENDRSLLTDDYNAQAGLLLGLFTTTSHW